MSRDERGFLGYSMLVERLGGAREVFLGAVLGAFAIFGVLYGLFRLLSFPIVRAKTDEGAVAAEEGALGVAATEAVRELMKPGT